ncbi:MAG: 50S ribosomal protein L35 [Candidatus Falkowbacteria bacterium]|jgi:ribosomal protein L35
MPKIKTHQATVKRFTVTKSKKLKHRKPGQDHFNARDTGSEGTKKRRDMTASKAFTKNIKQFIPYNV